MDDHDSHRHRVHCAVAALFIVFMALLLAHATWRFRPFSVHRREPAPASLDLKPICRFDVFRDIAGSRADGFVSGNGTWKRNGKGAPEHFQPEVCRFRHKIRIPRQEVLQCIRRHRLRYAVFAGDSNSKRYFAAFQALLTGDGAQCLSIQVCTRGVQ